MNWSRAVPRAVAPASLEAGNGPPLRLPQFCDYDGFTIPTTFVVDLALSD